MIQILMSIRPEWVDRMTLSQWIMAIILLGLSLAVVYVYIKLLVVLIIRAIRKRRGEI